MNTMRAIFRCFGPVAIGLAIAVPAYAQVRGLKVPDAFEVSEFAPSSLANDITCMTINPKGQIVVAGRGYIRVLVDDNNDGRADRAVDVSKHVKDHAMGLLWEGSTLLAVVDGGLWRFEIGVDGLTAKSAPEKIVALRTSSDHHAHALRRGPDGWLYLLVGDSTGIDETFGRRPSSPIHKPIAGCLIRFSPDFKETEIVADGFRNPYSFDFDLQGCAWTFDADNERCVSLPWYEPTRIYRIQPGGHHGWRAPQRSDTWRSPPYFVDVVAPAATAGRGSPTGVVFHRHTAWPASKRGLFVADWTFGKVWHLRPGFMQKPESFVESVGDHGFAPTALAIHETTGDMFISIGGRGTRGAVYRVHYKSTDTLDAGDFQDRLEYGRDPKTGETGWRVKPPQQMKLTAAYSVEWQPEYAKELPRRAGPNFGGDRAWAFVELRRHRERFDPQILADLIRHALDSTNPHMVMAVAKLAATLPERQRRSLAAEARFPTAWIIMGLAALESDAAAALDFGVRVLELDNANQRLTDPKLRVNVEWRLQAVRLIQLALGDLTASDAKATVWAGYSPRRPLPADRHPRVREALRNADAGESADLDRELTRLLAILEDDDSQCLARIVDRLDERSDPLDDVHHLIVISRLRAPRDARSTSRIAGALLSLDKKIAKLDRKRDRNWPLRLAELHAHLARKDASLNRLILQHEEFGRPDHAVFTRCAGFDRIEAARRFLKAAQQSAGFAWDSELIGLMSLLPAETHRPILRGLVQRGGLNDAILPILARAPDAQDIALIRYGLTSPRLELVRQSLEALTKLGGAGDSETLLALVRGWRTLPAGKEADRLSPLFAAQLQKLSGETFGPNPARWAEWLSRKHPQFEAKLANADGVDIERWRQRLARVDWSKGDAQRGKSIFARTSCAACHSGSQAMGPDLAGVAGRFSRDDLFTAILQPNKEIPHRYRMTQIETKDGKTYQGLIVYEAVDGLILQVGASETMRVAGDRIESKRMTETSLMPVGLLDKLDDVEIADLYRYLQSLGASPK